MGMISIHSDVCVSWFDTWPLMSVSFQIPQTDSSRKVCILCRKVSVIFEWSEPPADWRQIWGFVPAETYRSMFCNAVDEQHKLDNNKIIISWWHCGAVVSAHTL